MSDQLDEPITSDLIWRLWDFIHRFEPGEDGMARAVLRLELERQMAGRDERSGGPVDFPGA